LRTGERTRGLPRQEIGEIEEMAGFVPGVGQVALQPHQLRRFHFRRHDATDIIEHAMTGGSAFVSFGECAMVEPDDCVPARVAAGRDGKLSAARIADHQRACRIETDAGDVIGRHPGFFARGADGGADA
jgi:hypothetical protein